MPKTRSRPRPRGLQRVITGYLVALLALLCGVPAMVVGIVAANRCHDEGFRCLGYFVYGWIAAGAIAVIALPLLARRFRLGLWFALLTIALVVAPLVLGNGSVLAGTAFLGPGLAAWISEPIGPDPLALDPLVSDLDARAPDVPDPGGAPGPEAREPLGPVPEPPSSPVRYWAPRIGAALVISILLPCLERVF